MMKQLKLPYKLLYICILLLPLVTFGQLTSESYQVIGQSVGGAFVSTNAFSGSYAVTKETGGVYVLNTAVFDESTEGTRIPRPLEGEKEVVGTRIPYSSIASEILNDADYVFFCHENTNGTYTPSKQSVYAFAVLHQLGLEGSHDGEQGDIIPPFYYMYEDVLYLYSGKNWVGKKISLFTHGCTESTVDIPPDVVVYQAYDPTIEEREHRLVYIPGIMGQEAVTLHIPVGTGGLLRLNIDVGTFVIPEGVNPDEYAIYITIEQVDRIISKKIRNAVENDIFLENGTISHSSKLLDISPFLKVQITDAQGREVYPTYPLEASLFSPEAQYEDGVFFSLQSTELLTQWKEIAILKQEKLLVFPISQSGLYSFWHVSEMEEVPVLQGEHLLNPYAAILTFLSNQVGVLILLLLLIMMLVLLFYRRRLLIK